MGQPHGRRRAPDDYRSQRVKYLVEICDPCLACWYPVNGVPVADFYTPRYFDPVRVEGVRYSFTGAVDRPREILEGGYLTFLDPTRVGALLPALGRAGAAPCSLTRTACATNMPLRTLVDISPGPQRRAWIDGS